MMMRSLTAVLITTLLIAAPARVRANGEHSSAEALATQFERFTLYECTPCVRESYPVGVLRIVPTKLPQFPRAPMGAAGRPGEIAVEVLRAQKLGRPDFQSLALRVTVSVTVSPGGETYRLGVGVLDASEVRALAQISGEMAKVATAAPANPGAESVDVDFHGGSLRIGVVRMRGDVIAYVQTGDLATLLRLGIWEVPTTLYLPVSELPALATALGQAAAMIDKMRSN